MIFLFIACVMVLAALACWVLQGWALAAYRRYRSAFSRQVAAGMSEFFLFLDPAQLWLANLCGCVALALFCYLVSSLAWLAAAVGAAALLVPQCAVVAVRRRRLRRFDEQLPDMLRALASALRAGSGVQPALRHIVERAAPPLSQEFGLMLRQQRMGVSLEQALSALYRRMPTEAAGLAVSALNISLHTGGNLAETLERIADTLRARLHLLGRIRALTAQGRLQAWVMAGMPGALALALQYVDPDSMQYLWHTPAGWAALGLIAVLETVGVLFIRRIVAIDV